MVNIREVTLKAKTIRKHLLADLDRYRIKASVQGINVVVDNAFLYNVLNMNRTKYLVVRIWYCDLKDKIVMTII